MDDEFDLLEADTASITSTTSRSIVVTMAGGADNNASPLSQDSALFSGLPKTMSVKRRRAIEELVTTERAYVRDLQDVMTGYFGRIPESVRAGVCV